MDICSVSRPRCWGVTFDISNTTCTLFGSGQNFDKSYLSSSSHVDAAVARASQLTSPPPSADACPYLESSYQKSSSGEEFVIYCNVDFYGFGDYCPYSLGPLGCPPHADTMAGCLEICSQVHPLCRGVSWNPDMKPGYGNCYLKDDITAGKPSPPRDNYTVHSAGVTPAFADVTIGCPGEHSYTSSNGKSFSIHCYDSRMGSDNITSIHQTSVYACMDACSTLTNEGCKAVVFDDSMLEGYENCYLLNSTGAPNRGSNATFAEIIKVQDNVSSAKSKAWIAGPVVGVAVFLILVAVGLLYLRRRRSRARAGNHALPAHRLRFNGEGDQFSSGASELKGDTAKQASRHHELQSDPNEMVELTGNNGYERHELHGSEGVRSQHELQG